MTKSLQVTEAKATQRPFKNMPVLFILACQCHTMRWLCFVQVLTVFIESQHFCKLSERELQPTVAQRRRSSGTLHSPGPSCTLILTGTNPKWLEDLCALPWFICPFGKMTGTYISATPEFLLVFTPFFSKLKAIQRFSWETEFVFVPAPFNSVMLKTPLLPASRAKQITSHTYLYITRCHRNCGIFLDGLDLSFLDHSVNH